MTRRQKAYLPFKRLIDIFGSIIGIIVCFALLWWWVIPVNAIASKGNPMFARHRLGKNDKAFRCIKFRSMSKDADPHMSSSNENAQSYVTKFGKFLRVTSIDETPQLINILCGSMSFIGPRPLIDISDDYVTINLRRENGANTLRPGISGYAQVHGRTHVTKEAKGEMDGYYFKHFNFWMDAKIFIQSFFGVRNHGE